VVLKEEVGLFLQNGVILRVVILILQQQQLQRQKNTAIAAVILYIIRKNKLNPSSKPDGL